MKTIAALWTFAVLGALPAAARTPEFRAQDIDTRIEIGYGLAIADVDGDGKPDILLADKKQFVWYRNPSWTKHVLAENLTEKDNVCIAARDIDGDGKCEIAVGAEWNPGDTLNSGAVFYLVAPADRTLKWEAVKFPSVEPTTHRMRWVRRGDNADGGPRHDLVVVPLHGRGNKNGEGAGVKVLAYRVPKDPRGEWKSEVVCDDMHMTHNFDVVGPAPDARMEQLVVGGREGLGSTHGEGSSWGYKRIVSHSRYSPPLQGVGEVRIGRLGGDRLFAATIEPMHGTRLAVYFENRSDPENTSPPAMVLDSALEDGHALACGDLLGLGRDQIVVGWRANANKLARVGIRMFVPDESGGKWTPHLIDDNAMACEDLALADLNADGKPDIVAAGRRTKNVKVYWNESR